MQLNTAPLPSFTSLCFLALLALMATGHCQTPATEFETQKTQFQQQLGELETVRTTAISTSRARYVAALDAAEKRATQAARLDVVRALLAEKEAANQDVAMPPAPPPALPADLSPIRSAYIRECDRIAKASGPRAQALAAGYLRALTALEAKGKAAGDADLLAKINDEKTRAASYGVATNPASAARPTGKSVLVNGDFSKIEGDSSPVGWEGSKGKVVTERNETFLRLADGSCRQKIPVPAGAKNVRVSGRMRSADFLAETNGKFQSMDIAVLAVGGSKSGGFIMNLMVRGGSRTWTKVNETKPIPPDTKELEVSLTRWDARSATIDYDDVELIFR
jgi:hypothetical protein